MSEIENPPSPAPRRLHLPPGTELNHGYHEDSDSVKVNGEGAEVEVVSAENNGALQVRIVLADGSLSPEVFFYHQPTRKEGE